MAETLAPEGKNVPQIRVLAGNGLCTVNEFSVLTVSEQSMLSLIWRARRPLGGGSEGPRQSATAGCDEVRSVTAKCCG
jgi:hypothetical protein